MRINNIQDWKNDPSLNTMLFFAQRMDELLFHHSTDSYRYSVLSLGGISNEYLQTYDDVKKGLMHEKNLDHILEEFIYRLKKDKVAQDVLTKEYVEHFVKNVGTWNGREKYENLLFVSRKLNDTIYFRKVVELLRGCIITNGSKRDVDMYAGILVRMLIDAGYDENYIYKCVHDEFFHKTVEATKVFDDFISCFSFEAKAYDVYIGFSQDVSSLVPLFGKIKGQGVTISKVEKESLQVGIKAKRQKTIFRFENVSELDVFSAYTSVQRISNIIVNAYGYYTHIRDRIKTYGQVVDKEGKVTTIREKHLLKHRVSAMSHEESVSNAEKMLNVAFSKNINIGEIIKAIESHNAAIYSDNTSDALLSLWSVAESLSSDEDGDKINKVKQYMIPFLKSSYIEKLVRTCMMDIKRWNLDFFEENIQKKYPELSAIEATFGFLALDKSAEDRELLYSKTDMYPLLRYRIYNLNESLNTAKSFRNLVEEHIKRVAWHLHRIYRTRNYVIHDARQVNARNRELVINLHSYVDTTFSKIIDLLIKSTHYQDSIRNVVIEHRLKVSLMDEMCKSMGKDKISEDNLKKFLYYDFEL